MSFLTGKTVLVTGAGGSIGSELCRQIAQQDPKKLILFDNSELALYNIDREISGPGVVPVLGDITQTEDVGPVFSDNSIDAVFHAAAYKHVTLCEQNWRPAYRVNVEGTRKVASYASGFQVPTFVLISTDKAVRPTCVMGWNKKAAEFIVRELGYTVVRLGNVIGSSGSVVPLWKEQIAKGRPVTITDPNATRYFISHSAAATRVIQASAFPSGVYVPDMGDPINIVAPARTLGAKDFKYIGLRPGEKLHEELFVGERGCTNMPGIWEDVTA